MSEMWPLKPLGEICEILDKFRKPITKRDRVSGEYPYYGATGIVDYVDDYIFDEKLILIGEDGAKWESGENTAFSVEGKCWVNNHAHVIRPNRNIVLDNWLIYFLNMSDLTEHITGLTVPKLNQGKLRAIQIPIPPLEEQQRIVNILGEIIEDLDAVSLDVQDEINNLQRLFESQFDNLFSLEKENGVMVSMLEICSINSSLVDPKIEPYNSMLHIGPGNIQSKTGRISNVISAKEEGFKSGKYTFTKNMIIYGKINPYLQKVARPDFDGLCSADTYPLSPNLDIISRDYLFYLLLSPNFTKFANSKSHRAAQPKINRKDLFKFQTIIPSLEVQNQITNRLDNLAEEIGKVRSSLLLKLALIAVLKQSILQEAFSGKLTGGIAA